MIVVCGMNQVALTSKEPKELTFNFCWFFRNYRASHRMLTSRVLYFNFLEILQGFYKFDLILYYKFYIISNKIFLNFSYSLYSNAFFYHETTKVHLNYVLQQLE